MKRALVTGSSGLVGSEVCFGFHRAGFEVHGLDNNQRAVFFGAEGDTRWCQRRLEGSLERFSHHEVDIRDRNAILSLVDELRPDAIIHAAAQPSHDRSAALGFDDFDINAVGTLNLLEAAKRSCRDSPFVFLSTNKVYGDGPNRIPRKELDTRLEFADGAHAHGVGENFPIDQCTHSPFGASKAAADLLVQEYGRYFGMPTCAVRAGCLTGANHSGVELHGFLSYLVKCNVERREYRIYGYGGKQVRDNLHSADVASFALAFCASPRVGEVYNLGGGRENSCSLREAFAMTEALTGIGQRYTYVDEVRIGDHAVYYSDLRKIRSHFPGWTITRPLPEIFSDLVAGWRMRLAS